MDIKFKIPKKHGIKKEHLREVHLTQEEVMEEFERAYARYLHAVRKSRKSLKDFKNNKITLAVVTDEANQVRDIWGELACLETILTGDFQFTSTLWF